MVQKRLATEKVILVVGLNRIFTIKAGGKVLQSPQLPYIDSFYAKAAGLT